ncbi:protein kinase [Streptomyces sp. NPDC021098]|uniref:protein kinase domain-containing protein n=1 Tax=unclassified Streptomyces TaxID=2593676 RepID=UPI0037BBB429
MENLGAQDPRWIGEYQLLGRLGEGGMGKVYLARSARGRTVAVKLVQAELARQPDFRGRFKREVEAARRVGGQWTAPVLDADTEAAVPWVATGYIGGPSLHAVVAEDFGALPEQSVRVLAHGLSLALRDIHGAGLIHRDLKPSNILITIDGPRVIDFGIARALDAVGGGNSNLTMTGAVVGSPGFMSPEQVRGETVTTASDVFCLGSVLAFAATGRQPFGRVDSGIHALMYRIAQEEPDLEGLPEGLLGLVTACLSKDPVQRPSVTDLIAYTEAAAPDPAEPWLPGGLLARLGRDALQLLEAENPHQQATAAAPGPPQGAYANPSPAPSAYATPPTPSAYATPSGPAAPAYPMAQQPGQAWPQQGGYQPPAGGPGQGRKVLAVRALGNTLVAVFGVWMLMTISDLYLRMSQFGALRDMAAHEGSRAAVGRRTTAIQLLDPALGMCVVALVALWLVWFRRAYINATALSPGLLRFGSGYAVGAWFIPVALLWIPKQIANDIWTGSTPPGPGRVSRAALHWWWLLFVLMCFSAPSAGFLEVIVDTQNLDERISAAGHIVDDSISLMAAALAIAVVVKLTGMQDRRRAAQRRQQQQPVPAGVFGPPVS